MSMNINMLIKNQLCEWWCWHVDYNDIHADGAMVAMVAMIEHLIE